MTEEFDVNGFHCIYAKCNSKVSTVRLVVDAGSSQELPYEEGISHLIEHLTFKRTMHKSPSKLNFTLDQLGKSNGYTTYDRTVYYINCLSHDIFASLDVLLEMVFCQNILEDEFCKEKNVICQESKSRINDPMSMFLTEVDVFTTATTGHDILGKMECLENLNIADVKEHIQKWYVQKNMRIIIVSDLSINMIHSTVDICTKMWQNIWPIRNTDVPVKVIHDDLFVQKERNIFHNSSQSMIAMIFPTVSYEDSKQMNFVDDVFTCALREMLYNRLRVDLGICYAISAITSYYLHDGRIIIHTSLDRSNATLCITEILKCIEEMSTTELSSEVFDASIRKNIFDVYETLQTADWISSAILERKISPPDSYPSLETMLKMFPKITKANVKDFANIVIKDGYQLIKMNIG